MHEGRAPHHPPERRRHGVADADILHAHRHPIKVVEQPDGIDMYIGGDRDGQLLEVGVIDSVGGLTLIIHAMPARPKYLR
jgi:hypothetical protein